MKKGIDAERRFLDIARSIGSITEDLSLRIQSVKRAHAWQDQRGIDAFIILKDNENSIEVPVQVKSSFDGVRKFRKKYPEYVARGVLVIVVNNSYSNSDIARTLTEALLHVYHTQTDFQWLLENLLANKNKCMRTG